MTSQDNIDLKRTALAATKRLCRRLAPDVQFAAMFLPARRRGPVFAATALCAILERAAKQNAASGCCSGGSDDVLTMVGRAVRALWDDAPSAVDPRDEFALTLHAAHDAIQRFEIPRQHIDELLEGLQADVTTKRYATWTSLQQHCRRVTGSMALVGSCVLGLTSSDVREPILKLATATRLTRILANISADWKDGRVYLPLEDLARFRYSERDLEAGVVNDNFRELMRFEIERARELYSSGSEALRWLARDSARIAASVLVTNQSALLDVIEKRESDVLRDVPRVTLSHKLRLLPRVWRLARLSTG